MGLHVGHLILVNVTLSSAYSTGCLCILQHTPRLPYSTLGVCSSRGTAWVHVCCCSSHASDQRSLDAQQLQALLHILQSSQQLIKQHSSRSTVPLLQAACQADTCIRAAAYLPAQDAGHGCSPACAHHSQRLRSSPATKACSNSRADCMACTDLHTTGEHACKNYAVSDMVAIRRL